MSKLPVIVGLGGINAAGRSSGFHSYKRVLSKVLSDDVMASTWQDLANRMGLSVGDVEAIREGTLVRRMTNFDPLAVPQYYSANGSADISDVSFVTSKMKLPESLPTSWSVEELDSGKVRVTIQAPSEILLPITKAMEVTSGGSLPTGFNPGDLYPSRNHPRSIQLGVYGACDALNSLGLSWQTILKSISPHQVSVYAGGTLTQGDPDSLTGLVTNYQTGKRFHSKMMALSFSEMPADFINSYIINSVGTTGTSVGACATFLYNLRSGIQDIKSGTSRVVIVGTAEAPIQAEIMEGFAQMGALAKDEKLCQLDGTTEVNNRRACRPFSENAGFVMAESSQYVVLMDDELALELGANILGTAADVFISADANKKSIAAPGIGNYITMAKATSLAASLLGDEGLQQTYVQAHGTGTPQNRTSESHILDEVAKTFGIRDWPVTAVKSYVGHSIGSAGGDQLSNALGVWQHGWVPKIHGIDHIAEDVHDDHLNILTAHQQYGERGEDLRAAILNSKGFGGNNASAVILSPQETLDKLAQKHGDAAITSHAKRNESVAQASRDNDKAACEGNENIIYQFGENVLEEADVTMTRDEIRLTGFENPISL